MQQEQRGSHTGESSGQRGQGRDPDIMGDNVGVNTPQMAEEGVVAVAERGRRHPLLVFLGRSEERRVRDGPPSVCHQPASA